ncbi:FAD:protein FMN transferase [Streptomyces sp. NPDC058391]|uniref:FAD:protein FMN transferase n=1 Tax=Streptomyces sp. NPDC058391 TaxID=3346476 RepID=UPI0036581DAA
MSDRADGLRHVEHVMGTVFSFDIRGAVTRDIRRALAEAVAWLHEMDAVFSTYRADSAISRLSRGESTVDRCPEVVAEVLELCAEATRVTGGFFTVTPGGRLDPSGLVKGWAVEHASRILYESGAHDTYVNGGGDLQLRGEASPGVPWRIGIAHPLSRDRLIAVVDGRDLAVATSGTAERGAHVVDPRTGLPASGLLSITVTGRSLTRADVFATAAFAMGDGARSWIASQDGYEAMAVTADGRTWQSDGFPS